MRRGAKRTIRRGAVTCGVLLLAAVLVVEEGCVSSAPQPRTVDATGLPGELALAWYRMANRWVRCAPPSRLTEPEEFKGQNCAFYLGPGTGERDVRGAAHLACVYATLGTRGPYDESLSGVPREELVPAAIRLIRWMGLTYDHWRNQWQSAMWAAFGGQAAWLVWDDLDDETRDLVRDMVTGEADRFLDQTPPARLDRDTKAEENAWNSLSLVMAECLFPDDRRAPAWNRKAREYMLSSYLRPADIASSGMVDGFRFDSFAGANVRDDFSVENHGFFHPDYLACVTINMTNWVPYRLAGRQMPSSGTHNVQPIIRLLAQLSTPDGGSFYPTGNRWERLRRVMYAKVYAQVSVIFNDPDAAALERLCLQAAERLQGRFETGQFYAQAERRYFLAEELAAANSTWMYLLHALGGEGPEPTPTDELAQRLLGPRVLSEGRVAFNRTETTFGSFSWNDREAGYWTPLRPDIEVPPFSDMFLGRVRTPEHQGPVKVGRRAVARAQGEDLAVVASIWRDDAKRIRQDVAFVMLGDGRLIYLERLLATEDHTIKDLHTAVVYPPALRAGYPGEAFLKALPEGAWRPFTGEGGAALAGNWVPEGTSFKAGDTISRCAISLVSEGERDRLAVVARKLEVVETQSPDAIAVRDGDHVVVANFGDEPTAVDVESVPNGAPGLQVGPFTVLWRRLPLLLASGQAQ